MIIIAGCGFVGARLADQLHTAGLSVCGVTHSQTSAAELASTKPWRSEACDIRQQAAVESLAQRLSATPIQAVIHCASSGRGGPEAYQAVYVDGMRHLTATFPSAFPVYTSSTSVYAQTDGSTVTEDSPTSPPQATGKLLLAAEQIVLDHGGAAVRLAGLYGPGRSFVLKNLLEGNAGIEGTDGEGRIINQIHCDDAASAIAHIVLHRCQGVFNAVDSRPMTQKQCLTALADLFSLPCPGPKPPDPNRKRGWTNKAVSNARLLAHGWTPRYPTYFDALREDPDLLASIFDLIHQENPQRQLPKAPNILLIGLMGTGKTTIGRRIARKLGWDFLDTDAEIIAQAGGRTIPEIFADEGEDGFRLRESTVLRRLIGCRNTVIATGGGIVVRPVNRPLIRHLGFVIWLEASPSHLALRTSYSTDRPLLHGADATAKLTALLEARAPLYRTLSDLRIPTEDLNPEESAYGATESARVFFLQQLRRQAAQTNP